MSRVKEFDEAEVLDQALALFRARGFKQTSFVDLTRELGVSRQSLYDTYGDKQSLFQAALKRYTDRAVEGITRRLDDAAPVRAVFERLFEDLVAANCDCGSPGCMMVNSMVELAPRDPETRAVAQAHARRIEGLFVSRISQAQRKGEISRNKDPVDIARFLFHTMLGLSVAIRALGDRESLRATARLALQVLG